MPYGYNGRILHVDLTNGKIKIEEPDPAFYRKHVGGSAMGAYYPWKHIYLWVRNGEAELRDAAHLWGRFTADVEDAVREELEL